MEYRKAAEATSDLIDNKIIMTEYQKAAEATSDVIDNKITKVL